MKKKESKKETALIAGIVLLHPHPPGKRRQADNHTWMTRLKNELKWKKHYPKLIDSVTLPHSNFGKPR